MAAHPQDRSSAAAAEPKQCCQALITHARNAILGVPEPGPVRNFQDEYIPKSWSYKPEEPPTPLTARQTAVKALAAPRHVWGPGEIEETECIETVEVDSPHRHDSPFQTWTEESTDEETDPHGHRWHGTPPSADYSHWQPYGIVSQVRWPQEKEESSDEETHAYKTHNSL